MLKENPITIELLLGNKIEDDDIFPEISIKARDVFTKSKIQNNLQRIFVL